MAFFSRYKSAPQLQKLNDNTYVIFDASTPTDEEFTEEDEEELSEEGKDSEVNDEVAVPKDESGNAKQPPVVIEKSTVNEFTSHISPTMQSTKEHHVPKQTDISHTPQTAVIRHGYDSDVDIVRLRNSSSRDVRSEPCPIYQPFVIPESARGSNFPGELAGVNNLHDHNAPSYSPLTQSPRARSRLDRLRDAFRSPQINRKKWTKAKSDEETSPQLRKSKSENGTFVKIKKAMSEEGNRSPKARKTGSVDAIPEMSDWIIVHGYADLEVDQEFEVKRISEYDKYLSELLEETDTAHPDYQDLSMTLTRVQSMIKERDDELQEEIISGMEKSKDETHKDGLQPRESGDNGIINNNNINKNNYVPDVSNSNDTEDKDKHMIKPRGLSLRRLSAPSALLFKPLGARSKSSTSLWSSSPTSKKDPDTSPFKMAESNRKCVMEGPVQFAAGMQIQERYLFLFSDLLLVAKQKSTTAFKLKHRVHLCDLWIASCIDEVSETTRPADRSFVLGWPTTNVVATFSKAEQKEEWLEKLDKWIAEEKIKDKDKEMQLKVAPRDIQSSSCTSCHVTINNLTQVKDILQSCLEQLNISENEAKDYQLWVVSGKDGSPYPLIGHETPYSIKLNHIRGLSRSRSGDYIDNMTAAEFDTLLNNSSSGHKCEFYLKQKKTPRKNHFDDSAFQKSVKKNKKSPNIFNTLFRKRRQAQHLVFGLPLPEICDENLDPPEAIIKLMVLVYQQGPRTSGILRRGNKATLGKEIREKIDSGEKFQLEAHMAPTAASVFKEFLRCIPNGLLGNSMHDDWITVKKDDSHEEKIKKIKVILAKVPPAHYHMIKLTISLLQHLAKFKAQNHMGPSNLATCIAPSFYTYGTSTAPYPKLKGEALKQMQMQNSVFEIQNCIAPLISFMITNHVELFGKDILTMFTKYGCEASPPVNLHEGQMHQSTEDEEEDLVGEEEDDDDIGFNDQNSVKSHKLQQQQIIRDSNSGTDSDSMHSVLSMHDTGMGLRHNNSSIDSLVDRDYENESSPKAIKSQLSPNLSRDSGLTLSDTQLYDEEACHVDASNLSAKVYQRSTSHFHDRKSMEVSNQNGYYPNVVDHFTRTVNPVAPPRKRITRKSRELSEGGNNEHGYLIKRVPFKQSLSAAQADVDRKTAIPLLNQRAASDSIGEEDEITDEYFYPIDFQRMKEAADIGTILKSESGSRLFINEVTSPTKYCLGTSTVKSQRKFVRQSSVTDSTPPVSPQSRYSQSSHDSIISDVVSSHSQDETVHSPPQTPDELLDKLLVWMQHAGSLKNPLNGGQFIQNLNKRSLLTSCKSTSDLLSLCPENNRTIKNIPKIMPSSPRLWPGKYHEAEEIETNSRSSRLSIRPEFVSADPSYSLSLTSPPCSHLPDRKHWTPAHIDKGSPPPNVILQTLQSSARKELLRDSAAKFSSMKSYDQSINYIHPEEYINVTSKPIIVLPRGDSSLGASTTSSRRARLSKYMSSSVDLPTKDREFVFSEHKRPNKPPDYLYALERKLILRQHSLDTASDKAANDHDYECRNIKSKSADVTYANSNPTLSKCELSKSDSLINSSKISVNSRADFLDLEGISLGFQDSDKKNKIVVGNQIRSQNTVNKLSGFLSRNDSKLSDSGSTSSSSVTISTLDRFSDSVKHFSDLSDISSLTVSSSTTNDSISDISSLISQQGNGADHHDPIHSRHFIIEKPASSTMADTGVRTKENKTTSTFDHFKKDPKQLYIQSLQLYEQNASSGIPASTCQPQKHVHSTQPFSNSPQFQPPVNSQPCSSSQSSTTVPSQNTFSRRGQNESIKSGLGVQTFSLRNRSISVEHLHNFHHYNSPSAKISRNESSYTDRTESVNTKSPSDIISEHHQNFLKARSIFHQSVDDHTSPVISKRHSAHIPHQSSASESILGRWPPQSTASIPVAEDTTVESAFSARSRSKMPFKLGTLGDYKKEFHWSVKDLKSFYDKCYSEEAESSQISNDYTSWSKETTSQVQSHPHSLPPYHNPPPFRSSKDSFLGASKTPVKTINSHTTGSQIVTHDTLTSCSSSDERQSSLDKFSVISPHSSEPLSDYTNITYV